MNYDVTWTEVYKLLLAVVLGGVVGIEREVRDKPAGFRTMILIAVGSTLFTIFSLRVATPQGDPGRIAAQIVTGVGFLGAGAILRDRGRIAGLTTAAAIWLVASLGIGLGIGAFGPTLVGCGVVLVVLLVLSRVETWVDVRRDRREYSFTLTPDAGALARIRSLVAEHGLRVMTANVGRDPSAYRLVLVLMGSRDRHDALVDRLLGESVIVRFDRH